MQSAQMFNSTPLNTYSTTSIGQQLQNKKEELKLKGFSFVFLLDFTN